MLKKLLYLIVFVLLFSPPALLANTDLENALGEAASYFTQSLKDHHQEKSIVIQVINSLTKAKDQTSNALETQLYLALESHFPGFKLIQLAENTVGISSSKSIFIKGSYKKEGDTVTLLLQAYEGIMSGEILAQTEIKYAEARVVKKTLIAVLDLDAEILNEIQKKAFSEMFRDFLNSKRLFEMSNSADVDKMKPEAIQKQLGCTRDECAAIIGEQLGVDRVISTSMFKITDTLFVLSAKIVNIEDGSLMVTATEKHNGDLGTLDQALKKLADQLLEHPEYLGGNEKPQETAKPVVKRMEVKPVKIKKPEPKPVPPPEKAIKRVVRKKPMAMPVESKIESNDGRGPGFLSHASAITFTLVTGVSAMNYLGAAVDLSDKNKKIKQDYLSSEDETEKSRLQALYNSNKSKIGSYNSTAVLYEALFTVGLIWETILIFSGDSSDQASVSKPGWDSYHLLNPAQMEVQAGIIYRW
ncbi:MAG: hypothetical protein OEY59_06690 [Deltaproteobacteria bacterium]|nr:hypothetical protein [Deltaproteobacteria bacterium]